MTQTHNPQPRRKGAAATWYQTEKSLIFIQTRRFPHRLYILCRAGGGRGEGSQEKHLHQPGLKSDTVEINSASSVLLSPVTGCIQKAPEEAINLSPERGEVGSGERW